MNETETVLSARTASPAQACTLTSTVLSFHESFHNLAAQYDNKSNSAQLTLHEPVQQGKKEENKKWQRCCSHRSRKLRWRHMHGRRNHNRRIHTQFIQGNISMTRSSIATTDTPLETWSSHCTSATQNLLKRLTYMVLSEGLRTQRSQSFLACGAATKFVLSRVDSLSLCRHLLYTFRDV